MQEIYEQLLKARTQQRRERLLDEAASTPGCAEFLLEKARAATSGAPHEALEIVDLALEIARRRREPRLSAMLWRIRAQVLRALGRHAEALESFDEAKSQALQADDPCLAAQVQIGRIDSLGWLGRYDEAVTMGNRLAEELHRFGVHEDEAKALVNMGSVYFRRDRHTEALEYYERALNVLTASGDIVAEAMVKTNYANILTQLNRIDEAIQFYKEALDVFTPKGMSLAAALVNLNAGFLYHVSGEYAAAFASLNRARQEYAGQAKELETAKCDLDLADAYRGVNLFPEALACYTRAIEVFQRIPLDYERARAELGRASILMALGNAPEALAALESADQIFRIHKNAVQRAHVRLMRAYLLRADGDAAAASVEAQAAARTFMRQRLTAWAAEARFVLADIALQQGQDATRQMGAVGRMARRSRCGWLETRAEAALGTFYLNRADNKRALRHFRLAVGALEAARTLIAPEELHVAFLRDKLAVYELLVGTLLQRGSKRDVAEAFECVERSKSRLLLERVQAVMEGRLVIHSGRPAPIQEKLAALRAELSRGYHRLHTSNPEASRGGGGAVVQNLDELTSLEQSYRSTLREVELSETPSGLFRQSTVLPAEMLLQALRSDEMLIEYYIVNGSVCAFVLSPEGLHICPDLADLPTIEEMARRFRYHLQKIGIADRYQERHSRQMLCGIQRVLGQLYDALLRPLEPFMCVEKIVLVPHGVLHGLPFHAFFDGDAYALDRWEFVYAPSAAVWYAGALRQQQAPPRSIQETLQHALVMGVPEPGIANVIDEVERLQSMIPGAHVFCGSSATVEAFRHYAGSSRLIHLATHALFRADNPLFSGLQFAEGWLLARDLYELILDCDLATLSACRTGVTSVEPGDELFGLIRGFLSAGARSLAVSLWPTDDASTAVLMNHFYSLLSQGLSKGRALREALRTLRNHNPHPYHWAAFALVGER